MTVNFDCDDQTFGAVRQPAEVRACEDGRYPVSRYTIDNASIAFLKDFERAAQSPIFRNAALEMVFIWAIDADCRLHLAIEELALDDDDSLNVQGVPRPRKLRATKDFKKLGHPTLIVGDEKLARIAGELFLLRSEANIKVLVWGINAESGRFCTDLPADHRLGYQVRKPTRAQLRNVANMFEQYGLTISQVDDYRCV